MELSILKVLSYFDIFNYPLLENEIQFYLEPETQPKEFSSSLQQLVAAGIVHKFEIFYTLQKDFSLIERRKKGNRVAKLLVPKAKRVSNYLYLFPFVRGIGISGSLSKDFADENSDFDYFIITKTNRLWIASTLLGLFKKLSFIAGKQHWFCLNYFIDESYLEIPEKNIFTATELLTLLPTDGQETLSAFLRANNWVNQFYPNYKYKTGSLQKPLRMHYLKKVFETVFSNSVGDYLDNWLMKKAIIRWKKKKESGRLVDLKGTEIHLYLTNKHFCKHNPKYFQAKVLKAYSDRFEAVKNKWLMPKDRIILL